MAKRFKYSPFTDPKPTKFFNGWKSKAQRKHFTTREKLHKYVGGNDYHTPRRGHGKLSEKLAKLPTRLHPKKRRRR